ncbi:MAG: hypothetical protein RR063_11065 [Anaerovoracaceae bacterium]
MDVTDKDTYLEQKKMYEQMMEKMQENIEKQQAAVRQITDMDVPESAGLEMLDGRIQLTKLTKGIVDTFVEEIILFGEDVLEVRWKFQQCITK